MYYTEFPIEDNMEELKDLIFEKTNNYIEENTKKVSDEIYNNLTGDIEDYLYERFSNIRYRYFEEVTTFLLDRKYHSIDSNVKLKLEEWLSGLGYDQQKFRIKIYNDNKQIINQAITDDAIYERLEGMFDNGYFKSWEFKDITKGYPQSSIIKSFLKQLVELEGFKEELNKVIDEETKEKMNELNYLKKEIKETKDKLEELLDR